MDQVEFVRMSSSKNKVIFPKGIPPERQNKARIYKYFAAIVILLVAFGFQQSTEFVVKYFFAFLLVPFGVEFVQRSAQFAEEYEYLYSRYNNSLLVLINDAFAMHPRQIVVLFVACGVSLFAYKWETEHEIIPMFLIVTAVYLLKDILKLDDYPLSYSLRISEMQGLDYGSGIAHSFYHGYLKINLAPDGGLKDKMIIYESEMGINFHQYKMYVLVPKSMYCPHTLEHVSERIEKAKSLEPIVINRAGVHNRVYKNSVYKVNDYMTENKAYVCAEYASPLKTLDEVTNNSGLHSEYYKKHKLELLYQFYKTLKSLIAEDPDMANVCEVIYYNDKKPNGEFIDVGDLISKKLVHDDRKYKKKRLT